jgi:hypothetical protein
MVGMERRGSKSHGKGSMLMANLCLVEASLGVGGLLDGGELDESEAVVHLDSLDASEGLTPASDVIFGGTA